MNMINKHIKSRIVSRAMASTLILISIGMMVSGCKGNEGNEIGVYEELKSVNKMVLSSMAIAKTAVLEDPEWYGDRVSAYTYDSYMQAYLDMADFRPDDLIFDEGSKIVNIKLPAIQIEITGRDIELKRVYENVGLLRSDIDAKERAEMKERANRSFLKEVADNPVFRNELQKSAEQKARAYFETLLESTGYIPIIEFKN